MFDKVYFMAHSAPHAHGDGPPEAQMAVARFADDEPLIPMPALTPAALRAAVAHIAPAQLPSFVEHLDQATEQAAEQSTVAPLRSFLQWWGEFVAIQRYPARAARLAELESDAATAADLDELTGRVSEIRKILNTAQQEIAPVER